MGFYAELDNDKRVLRVVVCDSAQWLQERLGGTWVETSETTVDAQGAGPGLFDSEEVAPLRFIPLWRQPVGSTDAYTNGAWCWHEGRAWRSLQTANVFEPGVASWREMLVEWPEYVQPTGAQDAYQIGEKITFQGQRYISLINANVWTPAAYPAGWQVQP